MNTTVETAADAAPIAALIADYRRRHTLWIETQEHDASDEDKLRRLCIERFQAFERLVTAPCVSVGAFLVKLRALIEAEQQIALEAPKMNYDWEPIAIACVAFFESASTKLTTARPELSLIGIGPFFAAFGEDAKIVAKVLGLKLIRRGAEPACFLSRQRANDHMQRLVALGYPIAIHEEVETAKDARARGARRVRRECVRKVTPGVAA